MQSIQQLAAFALLALTPLFLAPPTCRAPAHINCASHMQNKSQNVHLDTKHGQSRLLAILLSMTTRLQTQAWAVTPECSWLIASTQDIEMDQTKMTICIDTGR